MAKKAIPKNGPTGGKVRKGKKRVKKESGVRLFFHSLSVFFQRTIVRYLLGIFFLILSVASLISLVSFLFTWAEDQSLLSDPELFSTTTGVENGLGKIGFLWSNFLVSKLFGLGAFIVPFFFFGVALFCFRRRKKVRILRLFFLSLYGAIILSALFSYLFSFTSANDLFGEGAGGSYGFYLNEWLVSMTGNVGAGFIIAFFLLIWLVLLNGRIADRLVALFESIFDRGGSSLSEGSGPDAAEDPGEDEEDEGEDQENEDEEPEEGYEEDDDGDDDIRDEDPLPEVETDGDDLPVLDIIPVPPVEKRPPVKGDSEDVGESAESDGADEKIPQLDILNPVSPEAGYSDTLTDEEWRRMYDPRLTLSHYKFPSLSLLKDYSSGATVVTHEELQKNNIKIVKTLRDYKIGISKISARIGPTVTLYEVVPAPGVRVQQIKRLEQDIAVALGANGVRVVILPSASAVGIEVPNEKPSIVSMQSLLGDPKFINTKYELPVVIGRTISNEPFSFDLAKMPHLLVAGATGQGKSVGLNAIITSLLYRKHPAELKLVLVDPKKVELSLYSPIEKHYLAKLPDADDAIITENKNVVYTLKSLCELMDRRYSLLKLASVRDIKAYNEKFLSRKLNPLKGHDFMPYIVVIIDEFSDLLMTAGREVEEPITRLAQLARAIGIHLVIATQRPTTNIITGTIKANFPARIAFRVLSGIDSKTILDQTGANQLVGRGDMLISTGSTEPVRVQCAFIDTPEVEEVTKSIASQAGYGGAFLLPDYTPEDESGSVVKGSGGEKDELFKEAARLIVLEQQASTSLIQRKMSLGYNRAGRIMDQLEDAGIVGPPEGSKPRVLRVTSMDTLEEILANL